MANYSIIIYNQVKVLASWLVHSKLIIICITIYIAIYYSPQIKILSSPKETCHGIARCNTYMAVLLEYMYLFKGC